MAKNRDIAGLLTGIPSSGLNPMDNLTSDQLMTRAFMGGMEQMGRGLRGLAGQDRRTPREIAMAQELQKQKEAEAREAQKQRADEAKRKQQQKAIISFAEKRYADNPEYINLIEAGVPLKDVESMSKGEKDYVVVGNSIYYPETKEFKTMPSTKSGRPPIVKSVFSEEKNANVIRFYDPNDPTKILKEELAPKDQGRSSVALLRLIDDTNNKAQEQRVKVQKVGALADKLDQAQGRISSGLASTAKEALDEVFGTQDYESELRTEAQRLRTSNAIKNLPAGPASDNDVALVLSGEPPANANPDYLARYARGIQK